MKTLKKNFEVKKVTVESMANCVCTNYVCETGCSNQCTTVYNYTGVESYLMTDRMATAVRANING